MNVFRTFWRWLTAPDPRPGLNPGKLGKLLLKSLLFALVAVTLQLVLRAAGLRFVDTIWGTFLIVLLVYIPFARVLSADFAPPPRPPANGKKMARVKKRKYAGVRKGGPRL